MAVTRERKNEQLQAFKDSIGQAQAIVMTDYRGLTVSQLEKLRRLLREQGASFTIGKKTLMALALHELKRPTPTDALAGPVGFAFLGDDLAAGAKVLRDFSKEAGEHFKILGGVLGNSVIDAAGAAALADMPSREVQLAQLLGAIAAPMTSLASLITGPHRDLIGLLQARIDKEGEAQAA
ncbi:MAG: 50S ribosomal protein L10 [Caldilineales bacterium]|nr:50S ribosomal protein L10 [Caldilineales bacterium]